MFERFTQDARQAIVAAHSEAAALGHGYLGTEHLLLGVLKADDGVASTVLVGMGVTLDAVRGEVERIIGRGDGAGLTDDDADALRSIGIDVDEIRRRAEESFGPGALDMPVDEGRRRWFSRGGQSGWLAHPFTPRSKRVMEDAFRESITRGDGYVGPAHLLLGLAASDGLSSEIMGSLGADPASVRGRVLEELDRAA